MIHKLIPILRSILIGLSVILLFTLESCWQKNDDYWFDINIENLTSLDLSVVVGKDPDLLPNRCFFDIQSKEFHRWSSFGTDGSVQDIHQNLFGQYIPFDTQINFYNNGVLVKQWNGPAKDLPEEQHDFYNYNSWEIECLDDDSGTITFTITDADLEVE